MPRPNLGGYGTSAAYFSTDGLDPPQQDELAKFLPNAIELNKSIDSAVNDFLIHHEMTKQAPATKKVKRHLLRVSKATKALVEILKDLDNPAIPAKFAAFNALGSGPTIYDVGNIHERVAALRRQADEAVSYLMQPPGRPGDGPDLQMLIQRLRTIWLDCGGCAQKLTKDDGWERGPFLDFVDRPPLGGPG